MPVLLSDKEKERIKTGKVWVQVGERGIGVYNPEQDKILRVKKLLTKLAEDGKLIVIGGILITISLLILL